MRTGLCQLGLAAWTEHVVVLNKQWTVNPCMTYAEGTSIYCPEIALHWAAYKILLHLPGFAATHLPALEFIPGQVVEEEQTGLWKELQEERNIWGNMVSFPAATSKAPRKILILIVILIRTMYVANLWINKWRNWNSLLGNIYATPLQQV